MKSIRTLFKKVFTSITIMLIPHGSFGALNLKVPLLGLVIPLIFAFIGAGYVVCLAVNGLEYKAQHRTMAEKLKFYAEHFDQWNSTVAALKRSEIEFQKLFAFKTREEVLENVDTAFVGSIDIPDLIAEVQKTIGAVDEIKQYLRVRKDIYAATPRGYPVSGTITSHYGNRTDPFNNESAFHSGLDISAGPGSPVHATADGIVSFSGWTQKSGFVVVLEHGCGFSTVYAHNRANSVKVGRRIKREEVIGYAGSTGRSTGPHVHYEVWKDGKNVDAERYL